MKNLLHLFITYYLFLLLLNPISAQDIKFEHISVEQGLSHGTVWCIFQDSKGFMWFGTGDGLNKFDGYEFTIFKYDPDDPSSLSNNEVRDIYEDHSTNLWLTTVGGGLNKFDRNTEKFTHYKYDHKNPTSINSNDINKVTGYRYVDREVLWIGTSNGLNKFDIETEQFARYLPTDQDFPYNYVEAIAVDSSGKVWIGCTDGGLHRFDPETEKYIHYRHNPNNPNSVSNNLICSLLLDRSGILWIGTEDGLNKFNPESGQFTIYRHDPNYSNSLSNNVVQTVYEDDNGTIWVGTMEGGLNKFNQKTQKFTRYKHDPNKPNNLSITSIMSIYQDNSDVLWIGTWQGGLYKVNPQSTQFTDPQFRPYLEDLNLPVWGICESDSGTLWVGTWGKGLVKINRKQGKVSRFNYEPNNFNSLSNIIVTHILHSRHNGRDLLWIGTRNGLNNLDVKTGQFTRYLNNPDDPKSISCHIIRDIYEDKTGVLWIGTQTGGLNRFDRKTRQFSRIGRREGILSIFEDNSGVVWFGGWSGLKKLDRETGQITTHWHTPDDQNSISSNNILSIFETSFKGKDILWIGTGGGLNRFDRNSEKFISYTTKDGLSNDAINGILEDKHGNLWLSTNNGLSKFNPVNETFRNYNAQDGLRSNQFVIGAYFQSSDGEMFFGGINGFDAFFPDKIEDNPWIPPVVITDFQIFNKPVRIKGDDSTESENEYFLPKHINTSEEIELSYRENIFSFEFAALDYRRPQKNKYAYLMEGVDPDWVFIDASRRFATYTNLDPGEYTFKVKGSNNDGIWNEEGSSIKIIITPPWWKTNWAYSFYLLFIGFIVFSIWRFQTSRLKMRQLMEMNHFEAEKLREVDHMKSRFFANISHEFRTPLTLIKGPVKQMLTGEFIGNLKDQYKLILRNSDRLLSLINQILDLSKLDSGRMILKVTCTEIYQLLNGLVQSFSSLAERKNISFKFNAADESIVGYVDRDKLEKIITNLLSNAFKFTAEGGEVVVNVKKHLPESPLDMGKGQLVKGDKGGCLQITISNTGAGIPPDQLGKIFDRFYQTNNYYTKDSEGSGIGLALTKELVEAHHGKIQVESELHKETTFTVLLPINKEDFNPEEIVKEAEVEDRKPEAIKQILLASTPDTDTRYQIPDTEEQSRVSNRSPVSGRQSPLVLIVEDNPDVTSYISSFLDKDYHIITAENGKTGLVTARDKFPDLIITDVMMPEMDGFELCSKLKSDTRTSHIPVILLTARADTESKIEGLEFGADDYISKPFEADELKTRVKNLIDLRRKLRERFQKELKIHPAEITAGSMDEKFLENICNIVEQHMDDENLTAEKLAIESNMSHRNLNRKLKALTGHSAQEFISIMRLKRAAQLLQTNSDTVTQIAYQVGFSSMSYFAKVFRHQFSTTPSQYRNHFNKSS